MTDWLESVSLVSDSEAILGLGAGGLALVTGSVVGFIPRVGLGRALSLGFQSYFKLCLLGNLRSSS